MKSFFFKILDAFGWHAEKPPYVNGQPLAFPPSRQKDVETAFICVNNGAPFPVPPSRLEGTIAYFELVVFGKMTYQVLALVPGGRAVASVITTAGDLRNSLQRGHMIKMIGMI